MDSHNAGRTPAAAADNLGKRLHSRVQEFWPPPPATGDAINAAMKRILVIRLRELGDSLLTTPMLRQLKRLYPQASVDVLCEPRSDVIFRCHPYVSQRFYFPRKAGLRHFAQLAWKLRSRRYDWVIDTQSVLKTQLLTWLTAGSRRHGLSHKPLLSRLTCTHVYHNGRRRAEYAAYINLKLLRDDRVDLDDLALDFHISPSDRQDAAHFRKQWLRPPVAAIYAVSHLPWQCWPAEKFVQIGDRLAAAGFQPFLVYGPGQAPAAREIALRMKYPAAVDYPMMSLSVLKGILEGCAVYVGNDGGPKHVACSCGVPTVSVFGHLHPENWTDPTRPDQRFLSIRSDCRAVRTIGRCTNAETLAEIEVDDVWEQIEWLMQQGYVPRPNSGAQVRKTA
jgi:heptosyltransferase-2/heptosyltransferase-3